MPRKAASRGIPASLQVSINAQSRVESSRIAPAPLKPLFDFGEVVEVVLHEQLRGSRLAARGNKQQKRFAESAEADLRHGVPLPDEAQAVQSKKIASTCLMCFDPLPISGAIPPVPRPSSPCPISSSRRSEDPVCQAEVYAVAVKAREQTVNGRTADSLATGFRIATPRADTSASRTERRRKSQCPGRSRLPGTRPLPRRAIKHHTVMPKSTTMQGPRQLLGGPTRTHDAFNGEARQGLCIESQHAVFSSSGGGIRRLVLK